MSSVFKRVDTLSKGENTKDSEVYSRIKVAIITFCTFSLTKVQAKILDVKRDNPVITTPTSAVLRPDYIAFRQSLRMQQIESSLLRFVDVDPMAQDKSASKYDDLMQRYQLDSEVKTRWVFV
jgi:hypothetical protein